MPRYSTNHTVSQLWLDLCPDEIEQRIIRAYVQLVFTASDPAGSRTVVVARFGSLDVRLTELPQGSEADDWPLFWLEIYSHAIASTVDSCGFSEFDESELAAAVELMLKARRRHELYH
ncbi:hypothetical protein AA309_29425 [Microvirga vignae]|uniref:Uncharacterized protein n=1 Tax=Microvirga vignae TaxID=1225564 RepID=A0A0H1RB45_9HYPH|nr:hypothetical protein [Microvirga vignae]KLK89787.1 hypothetical protein AA309_29425 [Microvirga vignae]